MEYRLLGALEVVSNGTRVELGPPKQRALLAVLLLHAGEVVSTDHLIDQVWGDHPPRTAAHSVQLYISDLRRSLEPVGEEAAIETRAPGYLLRVDTDHIDVRRLERLVAEGGRASSDGDTAEAVSRLEEALGLWRGSPLAEFAYDEFAQAEIRRLEELRLHAIEELAAAHLELGRAQDTLTALDAALAQDPLRERARELQMVALYRAGRHAEALRAYQRFVALLAEEVGLDPSPALRRLQERILLHDPTLAPTSTSNGHARNPYKGLSAFDEEDADDFFGRGELEERLLASLIEGARMVAVVGPSGGGKSSVVNAGLIPALRGGGVRGSERWVIARMLPGRRPLDELGVALAGAGVSGARERPLAALAEVARTGCGPGRDLLLVIDQFEEVFSAAGEADRDLLLEALSTLSEQKDGHARVLLTLRGDFYDRPLLHLRFSRVFVPNVVNVLPMAPDEIEAAILGPAARVDVVVEPSLRATLVADVAGEPGALPFLQFALTELFERRTDRGLTLDAYRELGGLHGVVSRRAERVYGHLDEEAREVALQVFLRLVRVGDGSRHSRRRARLAELTDIGADPVALSAVLDAFGRHRLLSFDRDPATGDATVEVAHEALLWGWERLAGWVERRRDDLRRRAILAAAAQEWRSSGRQPDYLLAGSRLAAYEDWVTETDLRLAASERAFLEASVRRRDDEQAEESATLEAHARLERRAQRWDDLWWLGSRPADTALVFAGYGDGGWNDTIAAAFDRGVSGFGLSAERVVTTWDSLEYEAELRRLSEDGVRLIVAADGSIKPSAFEAVAADHPDTRYIAIDIPTGRLDNVAYLNFEEQKGAFLAGAAAALKSQTGIVGFVGGADLPVVWRFEAGFEAGARAVRPDIEVRIVYLSRDFHGFMDPDDARREATRLYRNGTDVILHAAGGSGWGLFQAAYQVSRELGNHLWAIGADADQFEETRYAVGEDLALAWRKHILTSMMKRMDTAIDTVMTENARDEWIGGVRWFGLAEGGVGLSSSGGFLDDIRPELDRFRDQIISGEIDVPVVPTRLGG